MEPLTFTFKDAKNPTHVTANAKGMETMLRLWIRKVSITGSFTISFLTLNRNILPEKGIKLVSHDRMSLRIKLWADALPAECLLFPPKNISAENVFSLLASAMDEKRFISAPALYRDQRQIRNPVEEALNAAAARKLAEAPPTTLPEERGETIKAIADLLGLPSGMTRRYVNEVKSRLARAKLQRAAAAVTDGGLTVAKAAEQHGVDVEKLKEVLSGSRRKQHEGVRELRRTMSNLYRSVSQKNASRIRHLLEKYQDGDVTEKQVRDILKHLKELQRQSSRSVLEWESRFEVLAKEKKTE